MITAAVDLPGIATRLNPFAPQGSRGDGDERKGASVRAFELKKNERTSHGRYVRYTKTLKITEV